jgi:glycosyltransferase involved in cell wall biosynthesis
MNRKRILWLVSWYPNRNDRFDGDFIQRHARAAAIDHDVHVIFVTDAEISGDSEVEWNYATGLTEQILYFKRQPGWIGKIRKQYVWRRLFLKAVDDYILKNGAPACVHVHVPWKAGLIALALRKKFGWDFIVSEHWGIYNDIAEGNYFTQPFYIKNALKRIYKKAKAFVTVSKYAGDGVNKIVVPKTFSILPNVVDTTLFFNKDEKYSRFTFIHVSNMVPLKNVEGLLQAFKILVNKVSSPDVQLILVGNRNDEYLKKAKDLGLLHTSVFFRGEVPYTEVAKEMQLAHCLVVNSHIENSPCVIGEALCCGLPVIATRVGGIPEMVNPCNGILIPPASPESLAHVMEQMMATYSNFNLSAISAEAKTRYGYAAVAKNLDSIYQTVC